jgi:EAL domain-containing protein (putative c-di-GMP-specific phosphodiesterase class I)
VQVLRTDESEAAMVSAITTMARALHIDCLAEGVETAMQFQFLARQGCQSAQGYFFSRPLPADGLRQLLTRPGALAAPSAPRRGSGATV